MKHLIIIVLFLISFNASSQSNYKGFDKSNDVSIAITIGGLSFTGAALLSGSVGTYAISSSGSYYTAVTTTPPIWQQYPRNIMLITGITITFTGLITLFSNR